jgi:hypothetical protein
MEKTVMPENARKKTLPKDFLWGFATAAYVSLL